jgi:hypothetical protein
MWHYSPRRNRGDAMAHGSKSRAGIMQLFKADLFRYIAFGFGAGALMVLATTGIGGSDDIAHGVVPSAAAAPATP